MMSYTRCVNFVYLVIASVVTLFSLSGVRSDPGPEQHAVENLILVIRHCKFMTLLEILSAFTWRNSFLRQMYSFALKN